MKRLLCLLLCLAFAISLAACAPEDQNDPDANETSDIETEKPREIIEGYSGEGSKESPYLISTVEDLTRLSAITTDQENATMCEGVHFRLEKDLDLGGAEWLPIGVFSGYFDGNGHTVSNFKITDETKAAPISIGDKTYFKNIGFFGSVTNGNVANLTVDGCTLDMTNQSINYGCLVGIADNTTVENCHVKNSTMTLVRDDTDNLVAGGLVGLASHAVLKGCSADVAITADNSLDQADRVTTTVGGIVGEAYWNDNETPADPYQIQDCTSKAMITVDSEKETSFEAYVGGIAGSATMLKNCSYEGSITTGKAPIAVVGGIAGELDAAENCRVKATLTAKSDYEEQHVGGIAGEGETALACIFDGEILVSTQESANAFCGGIFAIAEKSVQNCLVKGSVTGRGYTIARVGGIVATLEEGGSVDSCIVTASISGSSNPQNNYSYFTFVGGIAASSGEGGSLKNCLVTGQLSSSAQKEYFGSIAGSFGTSVSNCYATEVFATQSSSASGEEVTAEQLNSASFYTDTLGLSAEIWEIGTPNAENGTYPTLK